MMRRSEINKTIVPGQACACCSNMADRVWRSRLDYKLRALCDECRRHEAEPMFALCQATKPGGPGTYFAMRPAVRKRIRVCVGPGEYLTVKEWAKQTFQQAVVVYDAEVAYERIGAEIEQAKTRPRAPAKPRRKPSLVRRGLELFFSPREIAYWRQGARG